LYVSALTFAVSGYSIWLSSLNRFRSRVLGIAIVLTLVQFLVNVIGQLWGPARPFRPFTVFYHYQPQELILGDNAYTNMDVWVRLLVLAGVGAAGYLLALWTFCRRDLPAPL
jgi:ABC-2 type transport system permease protein